MKELLIIETRDPAENRGPERMAATAAQLSARGVRVSILLAENGAFGARAGAARFLDQAIDSGVAVLADGFALEERAIARAELSKGVAAADIEIVVDRLAAGACVIWR